MNQDVYTGTLRLHGEEHEDTLHAADSYASTLVTAERFEEAKALMCTSIPVARRVLGESHELTLRIRLGYAQTLYGDPGATLDDLREAVTTLEETERVARRVLGGAHPLTMEIECAGWRAGARLHARENPNDDGGYIISIPLSRIDRA